MRLPRRALVIGCWVMLLVAAIHPAHGFGFTLCFFHSSTGVSCPGCGLVRSVSCTVRGDLASAFAYHPFGPLVTVIAAGIALTGSASRLRGAMTRLLQRHPSAFRRVYWAVVAAFLGFGVLRAVMQLWRMGFV